MDLSVAQILPKEINKMVSPNNPGFIDVNRTVSLEPLELQKDYLHLFLYPCLKSFHLQKFSNPVAQSADICKNPYFLEKS